MSGNEDPGDNHDDPKPPADPRLVLSVVVIAQPWPDGKKERTTALVFQGDIRHGAREYIAALQLASDTLQDERRKVQKAELMLRPEGKLIQ